MTFVFEGKKSFFLGSAASLIELDESPEREMAWAEKHVHANPAHAYILGRYVEADKSNQNGQYWRYDDLQIAKTTIDHIPLNICHQPRPAVGTVIASEFLYPTQAAEDDGIENPFIETLGVFWKYYYPDEYQIVKAAHDQGQCTFSMECIAETVTCIGSNGCGSEFPYKGPVHDSYCECLQARKSVKQLNKPTFLASAILVPPVQPGWTKAKVKDFSALITHYADQVETVYSGVATEFAHLDPKDWESIMFLVMQAAAPVSA